MKRLFIVLALFGIGLSRVQAQKKIRVSPNFGISLSQLNNGASDRIRASYIGGVDFRFGQIFNFVPGLYFGGVSTSVDYNTYQFNNSINTMQLRTLLGLTLINTDLLRVRALAGPSLHFTVFSKNIEQNNIKTAMAYLHFGGGLDLGILTVDLRFEYGLSPMFDKTGSQTIDIDQSNSSLVGTVGFVF